MKHGLRTPDCVQAVGSPVLWEEIVRAGWIKPVVNRHKLKIYDAGHVARVWARVVAGELPSREALETSNVQSELPSREALETNNVQS